MFFLTDPRISDLDLSKQQVYKPFTVKCMVKLDELDIFQSHLVTPDMEGGRLEHAHPVPVHRLGGE